MLQEALAAPVIILECERKNFGLSVSFIVVAGGATTEEAVTSPVQNSSGGNLFLHVGRRALALKRLNPAFKKKRRKSC